MEEVKEKKQKSKASKIIGNIVTWVFGTLFVIALAIQIISMSSRKDNYGVPCVAGYQVLVVLTDSMEPEYEVGTALFVKKVDPSEIRDADPDTGYQGDDLTFYWSAWGNIMKNPVVTHRCEEAHYDESTGKYVFTCHGINTVSDNCNGDCTGQTQTFNEDVLLGKVVGSSKFVGRIYSFISSIWGLLILMAVPCGYLLISSFIDISKTLKSNDEEASEDANSSLTNTSINADVLNSLSEEDKKRLKEELLEELLNSKKEDK